MERCARVVPEIVREAYVMDTSWRSSITKIVGAEDGNSELCLGWRVRIRFYEAAVIFEIDRYENHAKIALGTKKFETLPKQAQAV